MPTSKTRLKTPAKIDTPQSRDDTARAIREIGDLQRDVARLTADMNDQIAKVTQQYQPQIDALKERVQGLHDGVLTWCSANRAQLTEGGRVKTANLVTGEISWRNRPPSCSVRNAEGVIETLLRMDLSRFVRTKQEVNKEAILEEPDAVRGIAGITISTGVEDFVITPFEQQVPA